MGWRFRRSAKFGPFRLTATGRGVGVSVGVKGARVGIGADGRVRETLSVPGTGISYQETHRARATLPPSRRAGLSVSVHAVWIGIVVLAVLYFACSGR